MKVTEQVEHLLRQGRKPKELVELGFPKSVVTRVRRRLREENLVERVSTTELRTAAPPAAAVQEKPDLRRLQDQVDILSLWVSILQLTVGQLGLACPQCFNGVLRWEEWQDGNLWDGAFICEKCRHQPPRVPESSRLYE